MRISDWSSDVCSSDLRASRKAVVREEASAEACSGELASIKSSLAVCTGSGSHGPTYSTRARSAERRTSRQWRVHPVGTHARGVSLPARALDLTFRAVAWPPTSGPAAGRRVRCGGARRAGGGGPRGVGRGGGERGGG